MTSEVHCTVFSNLIAFSSLSWVRMILNCLFLSLLFFIVSPHFMLLINIFNLHIWGIYVSESCGVCPSETRLFYLTLCFCDLWTLLLIAEIHSPSLMSISPYDYITVYYFYCLWVLKKGTWEVNILTFCWLKISFYPYPWLIFGHSFLFGNNFSSEFRRHCPNVFNL